MVIVKLGGRVRSSPELIPALAAWWQATPGSFAVVHGGGDDVSAFQRQLGREPSFVNGRRITSEEDVDLVRMVLSGSSNKRLVAELVAAGVPAAGVSGEDGGMIEAEPIDLEAYGRAGKPVGVRTDLINTRSPSLRDLEGPGGTLNGGLMHDGSITSLLGVINHYAAIPGDNANLDNRLRRPGGNVQTLPLNTQQRNDLVAFLRTLTGAAVYTDPKWSSPFNASGELDLIIISSSSISFQSNGDGTATLRCKAAPGLNYQLQSAPTPSGTWANVTAVTADANGLLLHTVSVGGGGVSFFRFTYTPPAS